MRTPFSESAAVTAAVSEHMAKHILQNQSYFYKCKVAIFRTPLAQVSNFGVLPLSSLSPACSLSSPPRTTHKCSLSMQPNRGWLSGVAYTLRVRPAERRASVVRAASVFGNIICPFHLFFLGHRLGRSIRFEYASRRRCRSCPTPGGWRDFCGCDDGYSGVPKGHCGPTDEPADPVPRHQRVHMLPRGRRNFAEQFTWQRHREHFWCHSPLNFSHFNLGTACPGGTGTSGHPDFKTP
jgi:hypothetical protein